MATNKSVWKKTCDVAQTESQHLKLNRFIEKKYVFSLNTILSKGHFQYKKADWQVDVLAPEKEKFVFFRAVRKLD